MEDIMKLHTKWARGLVAGLIKKLLRNAGFDVDIEITGISMAHSEETGKIRIALNSTVELDEQTLEKMIQRGDIYG